MRTLLFTNYMSKMTTFHYLPSSRSSPSPIEVNPEET
jgi:hypothetical protein